MESNDNLFSPYLQYKEASSPNIFIKGKEVEIEIKGERDCKSNVPMFSS